MPRVHFVKAARKENPVAKVGQSYYWWKFRNGGKRYSLERPKPWDLTQSPFRKQYLMIEHSISTMTAESFDDLESQIESITEEIRQLGEECRENRENMPESLQDSETGQLLEERADGMESWADELENVFQAFDQDSDDFDTTEEALEDLISQLQSCDPGI